MSFKIVRPSGRAPSEHELAVMDKIGTTMEIVPRAPGPRRNLPTEEELVALCHDADVVMTVFDPFTRNVIERLEKCRAIVSMAVGYQDIDVEAATDCGMCVVNNLDFNKEEVSDHAMTLLLALAREILTLNKAIHQRVGTTEPMNLAQVRGRVFRLRGQTLGLVGLGNIPRTLVPKARGFEFRIIAHDPFIPAEVAKEAGVELVDFDRLLEESDYISIHAALTPKNVGMFGLEQFKKIKPTAFLINTARGGLIDEPALYTALTEGYIAGAGLDVTEPEPIQADNPLLKLENVILTGHSAFFSEASVAEADKSPIEDIARLLSGEWPRALRNPEVKEKYTQRWGSPQSGWPKITR